MAVLSKCVVVASLVHFALGMKGGGLEGPQKKEITKLSDLPSCFFDTATCKDFECELLLQNLLMPKSNNVEGPPVVLRTPLSDEKNLILEPDESKTNKYEHFLQFHQWRELPEDLVIDVNSTASVTLNNFNVMEDFSFLEYKQLFKAKVDDDSLIKAIFEAVDKSQNEHGKLILKKDQTWKNYVSLVEAQQSPDADNWVNGLTNLQTLQQLQEEVKNKLSNDVQQFVSLLDDETIDLKKVSQKEEAGTCNLKFYTLVSKLNQDSDSVVEYVNFKKKSEFNAESLKTACFDRLPSPVQQFVSLVNNDETAPDLTSEVDESKVDASKLDASVAKKSGNNLKFYMKVLTLNTASRTWAVTYVNFKNNFPKGFDRFDDLLKACFQRMTQTDKDFLSLELQRFFGQLHTQDMKDITAQVNDIKKNTAQLNKKQKAAIAGEVKNALNKNGTLHGMLADIKKTTAQLGDITAKIADIQSITAQFKADNNGTLYKMLAKNGSANNGSAIADEVKKALNGTGDSLIAEEVKKATKDIAGEVKNALNIAGEVKNALNIADEVKNALNIGTGDSLQKQIVEEVKKATKKSVVEKVVYAVISAGFGAAVATFAIKMLNRSAGGQGYTDNESESQE